MIFLLNSDEKRIETLLIEEFRNKTKELTDKIEAAPKDQRKDLILERTRLRIEFNTRLTAFTEECERKHFKQFKDDIQLIKKDAIEQIPLIIDYSYHSLVEYNSEKDLNTLREFIEKKKDKLLLRANFAIDFIINELKLHLEALQKDQDALQEVLSCIIETVEQSEKTNNEDITITIPTGKMEDAAQLMDISRLMRNPLADITTYGLMNDKINAQLIQGDFFTQEANGQLTIKFAVDQAPQNKKQVPVYMALTYEGTEGKLTKRLTAFDSAVYNAVATRFYYWQQENIRSPLYITPQEIWRTMNGKKTGDGKAKPSAAQVKRICDSLDKMRFTHFYMDISEEIQAFNLYIDDDRVTAGKIDTYVLNCSKVEFETEKGNAVQGYKIGDEPILYTYNRVKNHILYVPYEMLDTSTNTSDSENVTEFRNYLLQQIQLMKNAKEGKGKYYQRNRIILIETIYRDTGIQPPEERINSKDFKTANSKQTVIRRLRKTDREKIEGILEAWKTKSWIKGYIVLNQKNEPIKEKQQAKGYEIIL